MIRGTACIASNSLFRYVLYDPILPSGILLFHGAFGSFGRQRSSDSWRLEEADGRCVCSSNLSE
jgi:hypothetical protein